MKRRHRKYLEIWLFGGSLVALFAALEAGPALSQKVGTAAAVNPASIGRPPAGTERELSIGAEIIHKERIRTTANGSLQVLLVDRTTLSIGPNSDITIDEFVYDPNAKTGKLALSVGKGLLRFVGGQVSHTAGATVNTPAATMGIRGGIAIYLVEGGSATLVHQFGRSTVKNGDQTVTISQPGFYVQVPGRGAPVSEVKPVPPGLLAALYAQLQSKPGQTGGIETAGKGKSGDDGDITGSIPNQKANNAAVNSKSWISDFLNLQNSGTDFVSTPAGGPPPPQKGGGTGADPSTPPPLPPPVITGGFITPGQPLGIPGNPNPPGNPGGPGLNPGQGHGNLSKGGGKGN